jgi:UDP-N-acetyl-D-glucosamine dehydrogenase
VTTLDLDTPATTGLFARILDRRATLAVVGQGYVGLSLTCAAAIEGFPVFGIDIDEARIADLNAGRPTIPGIDKGFFSSAVDSGRVRFTSDSDAIAVADVIAICVPTPLRDHTPDLSFVESACDEVARHLTRGTLVVLESTTYPGTTQDLVRPALESAGLTVGRDFLLAYCPERIDPGNDSFETSQIPRVVGGIDEQSAAAAALFYRQFVDEVITVSSCRTAELTKLLENTFRHVNIALVNEMAMLCRETHIDVWEVIDAAASKPFGFMPFYPGPGIGGHCIPLDPNYLAWQMRRDVGHQFRILEQSQDINAQMPGYVGTRIADALNDTGRALRGTSILLLGIAYKPDVGDVRESPSVRVLHWLRRRGADVEFHDPYIESVALNGNRLNRTELTAAALRQAACVALLTPHSSYDVGWIAQHSELVFDARNAFGNSIYPNVVRL